jgi:AcrR family transcriptional regulator
MATTLAANRIAERKLRDKQARRAQIISAARRIAELEGWSNVTVRRLSDEISYSQPVLYAHFGSREGILAAVAIEGFQEMGLALECALIGHLDESVNIPCYRRNCMSWDAFSALQNQGRKSRSGWHCEGSRHYRQELPHTNFPKPRLLECPKSRPISRFYDP